jgi:hypothetical protein
MPQARIGVRHPVESPGPGSGFHAFSDGVLTREEANQRFDRMAARCAEIPFAKQPIVEFASGEVVGHAGGILAIVHAGNQPAQNVCRKLGFGFWKIGLVQGEPRHLSRINSRQEA